MSAWNDYVTAALLGAEKATPPALPTVIEPTLGATADLEREARFLTQAGALTLWRRAGWKPAPNETEIRESEPEATKPVTRASAAHLRAMLEGAAPPCSRNGSAKRPGWVATCRPSCFRPCSIAPDRIARSDPS